MMLRSQSLLAALIACLVIIFSSSTNNVVSAEGVRVKGRARRTSGSQQQRDSRPSTSSKNPSAVPGRQLKSSKSGMGRGRGRGRSSRSMMSKSASSRSGRGRMMSKSASSRSSFRGRMMMMMRRPNMMRMRPMRMMMRPGFNQTRADDIDDLEDLFIGLGFADETFDSPLEALEAFDEIRVDGLRTFPIASRLVFSFFPGTGREPTIGEVAVVEDATVRFFQEEFKDNRNFGSVYEDFSIGSVETIYRAEAVPDKFTLEFVAAVTVDTDSPDFSPRRINARTALGVMSRSNFKQFIGEYVRQAGGIWNEFYQTHAVRFRGVGRNDS